MEYPLMVKTNYVVLVAKNQTEALDRQVSEFLQEGWEVYGNIVVFPWDGSIYFAQAMLGNGDPRAAQRHFQPCFFVDGREIESRSGGDYPD
jgi:Domain of unknown function (DUF1737)